METVELFAISNFSVFETGSIEAYLFNNECLSSHGTAPPYCLTYTIVLGDRAASYNNATTEHQS